MCVEVSLARNEPSVRGGQSLTKTIGIKVCGNFCHRISVTRSPEQISLVESGGCARQTPIQNWNWNFQLLTATKNKYISSGRSGISYLVRVEMR